MSQVFSTPPPGDGAQRISAEEAKALIRAHQNREAALQTSVTVQDMSEVLGLPTWQVEQMVQDLRHRSPALNAPMPAKEWLMKRLWLWAIVAVMMLAIGTGGFGLAGKGGVLGDAITRAFSPSRRPDRVNTDGIYDHDKVVLGREAGMTSTPGFSYEVKYDNFDAAANGASKHYVRVEDLSKDNVAIVQQQFADKIVDGLDKAVKHQAPNWVDGEAAAVVKPNYYPGGLPPSVDITLKQAAFPYDPASPSGKELHDKVLQALQDHWSDITD